MPKEKPLRHRTPLAFEPEAGAASQALWAKALKRHGGFDPSTNEMRPFKANIHDMGLYDRNRPYQSSSWFLLDSIAGAREAGLFDQETFVEVCFASRVGLTRFLDKLRWTGGWVNERHFYTFMSLLDGDPLVCHDFVEIEKHLRVKYAPETTRRALAIARAREKRLAAKG